MWNTKPADLESQVLYIKLKLALYIHISSSISKKSDKLTCSSDVRGYVTFFRNLEKALSRGSVRIVLVIHRAFYLHMLLHFILNVSVKMGRMRL